MSTPPKEGPLAPDEVDGFVREADRLAQVSHAQRNQFLMTRWLPYGEPPRQADGRSDPFGPAFTQWVLQQWSQASGRAVYALELEHDDNVAATDEQLQRLYPFVSGDTAFVSQYMIGVYHALGLLSDAPNRRMVEYGVGWGNTTVAMLQSGYHVLAVDIDPKWLNLLKLRAAKLGVADKLQTLHGEFGTLPAEMEAPGGVLFYECFHHALNHDDTLARIAARLADGGLVIFAGETIFKDFPHDWGVRLDGHSVWAIRRYGWMELAFSEDYFIRLTRRHHLALQHHQLAGLGTFGLVYKAVLDRQGVALGHTMLTSQESGFLAPEVSGAVHTRFTTGHALLELPCGAPQVSLELKNWLSVPVAVKVQVDGGPTWSGLVPANSAQMVTLPHTRSGYYRLAHIHSDTHVPAALGINGDSRRLGIAVGRVRFHA
jgi:SAM-dependent methyltransferase